MINNCKEKEIKKRYITGFTLIEIIIAILILGILFGFGSNYFVSFLREHSISVQNDFLHREAIYAMDFIINGRMELDQNAFSSNDGIRNDGIISSHDVSIYETSNGQRENVTEDCVRGGSEIWLFNDSNSFLGRIYSDPSYDPPSLLFSEDQEGDEAAYRIIPKGSSNTRIQDPYEIGINFRIDCNTPYLIDIMLWLDQKAYDRKLHIELHSAVGLRNKELRE